MKTIIITDGGPTKGFKAIEELAKRHPELGLRFYGVRYHDDFDDTQIENRGVLVNRAGIAVMNYEPSWDIEYPDGLKIVASTWDYIENSDEPESAFSDGEEEQFIKEVLRTE